MNAGNLLLGIAIIAVVILFMRGGTGRIGLVLALVVGASVAIVGDLSAMAVQLGGNVAQMVASLGGSL